MTLSLTESSLQVYEALDRILGCACGRMTELVEDDDTYPGCPCRMEVAGGEPPWDNCCDWQCSQDHVHGLLVSWASDIFETDPFPERANSVYPCDRKMLATLTTTQVIRCGPSMDEFGHEASADQRERAARVQYQDLWALESALRCCVTDLPSGGRRKRRTQIIVAQPLTREGDCLGVEVQAFVEVGVPCSCEAEAS